MNEFEAKKQELEVANKELAKSIERLKNVSEIFEKLTKSLENLHIATKGQ